MTRRDPPDDVLGQIRWPLRLTRWGMVAERAVRAFWPLWSVMIVLLSALMLGLQDLVPVEWVWVAGAAGGTLALWSLWFGVRRFRLPPPEAALARLDRSLKGHPIQTALDRQAVGAGDGASLAVWQAHQERMRRQLTTAKAVEPDLAVARNDPYALRYVALLALSVAILFGSLVRVQSVTTMGAGGPDLAQGPAWEGWMEPPSYTGLPSVYLNDITAAALSAPEGAQITLRMYGEVGALSVSESVSGRPIEQAPSTETAQDFAVLQSGDLAIEGQGGRVWSVAMIPDSAPEVAMDGEIETTYEGESQIPFSVSDDHGVVAGTARFTLALDEVDRRFGREIAPEARPALRVPLPMPVAGDRADFSEILIENYSKHPYANLPVRLELEVEDDRGQVGLSPIEVIDLPGRNFFDPMAAALIEQRQALLWNRQNATDIAQILRAISNDEGNAFRSEVQALRARDILTRLERLASYGLPDSAQQELAEDLWGLALDLEEGDLANALERLRRAQERLEEAMRNGASPDEIAELMQELREATDDYLRQLGREQAENGDQPMSSQDMQNSMEMSQNDLQRMMDRIQELMEEGRMAEAQEALEQLRQMMENMQVTQGQGGQGQSPGEQAMEGLSETLREQQGLSDEAFRNLQDQFGQDQQGQGQEGQGQQPGQQQGQGQGQMPGQGQGQGQGQQQQGQGGGDGQSLSDELADRQQSLRDELGRQSRNLPGRGTEEGDRAAEALGRAEEAMDDAEQALRDGDLPGAISEQSEAMEALREGMRNLGEALAQQQQQGQGQQGMAEGGDPGERRDPLGRNAGNNGQVGSEEGMLQGEDVYRRARELLDEIRRRTGNAERPTAELEYLERLLERF